MGTGMARRSRLLSLCRIIGAFSGPNHWIQPAANKRGHTQLPDDPMNITPKSPPFLLVVMSMFVAACGPERDRLSITMADNKVFGEETMDVSVHASADIRRGDLQVNITAQGGIAECPFVNPLPIFGADEEESPLAYNSDERPSAFGELLKVCEFGVRRVEEVTARIDGKRMRCRLDDTPDTEDDTPQQKQEAEEEAGRGLIGFQWPEVTPPELRKYSCQ